MNAIQFAPRDSEVNIVIVGHDNQVVLDILDCGPGIPPNSVKSRLQVNTWFLMVG